MNPLNIITILIITVVIEFILVIVQAIRLRQVNTKLNEANDSCSTMQNRVLGTQDIIKSQDLKYNEVTSKYIDLKFQFTKQQANIAELTTTVFKLESELILANDTENNLKSIIKEHDTDMRQQRDRFEKLLNTYIEKKDVITHVQDAFKAGNNCFGTVKEYIKDFKANF